VTATYTFDIFTSLDGNASYGPPGDWDSSWAARPDRQGPPWEQRIPWDDLPVSLKDAISARTGPVISGRAAMDGQNSPLAAVLDTRDGKVFVKGLPSGHRLIVTQAREAAAAPLAKGLSPELLWQFDEDGWNVNGFEHINGRKANFQPGSPDIGPVTDLMTALSGIEIPPGPGPWKPIAARLPAYAAADPGHVAVFARANRKMWDEIEADRPVPWTQAMAAAARVWAQHREHTARS
jgi:hypothetical protein